MSHSDEARIQRIVHNFLSDNIPEHIRDGAQYLIADGGIQKIDIRRDEDSWDVEGQIQGDDFQTYSSELGINLDQGTINSYCNCQDSFSGICRHVAATALGLLSKLDVKREVEAQPIKSEWKQSFRYFFSTALEPEPGHHYFIYRFFAETGRLQIEFFRARQNKSGLSTVQNPVTLEQIIRNPDWCEISPELPKVCEQIGQYLDYYGHRVEIPFGLMTWFFWAIKNEYYQLWEESEQPVRIESTPMRLQLRPKFTDDGLSFDIMLGREGKVPFSILNQNVSFYGHLPLWVCLKHSFYPVQTGLRPSLIKELVISPPVIPHADISEFLDRVWTQIPASDLHGQEEFLERMQPIFVPANYNPKLFLNEEGSLLTLEIQNIYETEHGDISLPGPNQDLQTGSYQFEGKSFLIRRDQEEEEELHLVPGARRGHHLPARRLPQAGRSLPRLRRKGSGPLQGSPDPAQRGGHGGDAGRGQVVQPRDQCRIRRHLRAHRQDLEGLDPGQALCATQRRFLHQPARSVARKTRTQAHRPRP
jgi:non-specific serine/threonine protein kinase